MSRPIKFRGIDVETGAMVYGSLINNMFFRRGGEPVPYIVDTEQYPDFDSFTDVEELAVRVDPETVGQYTGLQDKHGKEIFERDLLQDDDGIGEVEWVQEHCAFMVFTRNPSTYHRLESDGRLKSSVVVGNCFDHPHLLGGDKDA